MNIKQSISAIATTALALLVLAGCARPASPPPVITPMATTAVLHCAEPLPESSSRAPHCARFEWLPRGGVHLAPTFGQANKSITVPDKLGAQLIINGGQASSSSTISGDVTGTLGASVVSKISGSSPINITPSVLQWTAATATPTITQATPTSDVATVPLLIQSQAPWASAVTHLVPGNLVLNVPGAAGAGTAFGWLQMQQFGTNVLQFGNLVGQSNATYGAIYPGAVVPSATNFLLFTSSTGSLVTLNTTSGGTINFTSAGQTSLQLSSTGVSLGVALGGLNGISPFHFSGQTSPNTVACGTGGTQTISAAQAIIPFFLLTATNPLTSNCIIDFSTNASTGWFTLDVTGALAIGAGGFTIGFKNGSKTQTFNLSQLTAFAATGMTSMTVKTYGTNLITVGGG